MITQSSQMPASKKREDISVFPISIPMLAGPGSLTLAILLYSNSDSSLDISLAIMTLSLLTFCLMLLSAYVKKIIGKTGDEILKRFLGVILAALAIQFVYDGLVNITA